MMLVSCRDAKTIEERPFGSVEDKDTSGILTFEASYLENQLDSCPMRTLSIFPVDSTFSIIWRFGSDSITTGHIVQENVKDTAVWKLVCDSDNNIYLLSRGESNSGDWLFTSFDDSTYIKNQIVLKQQVGQ